MDAKVMSEYYSYLQATLPKAEVVEYSIKKQNETYAERVFASQIACSDLEEYYSSISHPRGSKTVTFIYDDNWELATSNAA